MTFENLIWQQNDQIVLITINRPQKLNALNVKTMQELDQAFSAVYADPNIRGVILTGSGEKAFVAGADISEIAHLDAPHGNYFAAKGQAVFAKIENCPKPVIAAVNGFALGGGCELAMACHLRVATENAIFGQPEVKLGIIPGYGGTQRLTQLVGKGKAIELMMTADNLKAAEALQLGLVNYLVQKDELLPKCFEILNKVLDKAPLAVAEVIRAVNAYYGLENGYTVEAFGFGVCCDTTDFKEGTTAFLEKRKANFIGN